MKSAGFVLALGLAAGCTVQFSDATYALAAIEVVRPLLAPGLSAAEADVAARCVADHATLAENKIFAGNLGNPVPGSQTLAALDAVLARPQTAACLADAGIALPHP